MDYCYSWNGLADSGNGNFKYYNNGIVNRNYTGFTIYNGDWYLMKMAVLIPHIRVYIITTKSGGI